ncbi:MAG: hypothetical protein WA941_16750 [Nitrososphaeraceae archaeon]
MIGNVSSDIGILILQGENDSKTRIEQGLQLRQRLTVGYDNSCRKIASKVVAFTSKNRSGDKIHNKYIYTDSYTK